VRTRQDLGEKQTGLKAQIQMLIKRHGIEKPEGVKGKWESILEGMAEGRFGGPESRSRDAHDFGEFVAAVGIQYG